MPPEEPQGLVALKLDMDGTALTCRGERVFPSHGPLRISWYTATANTPQGYVQILDGVVFGYKDSIASIVEVDRFSPRRVGERYYWRDHASAQGLMIAVVLPLGQTLAYWEPELIEAKSFSKTIAAFWLLYPKSEADTAVSISWSLTEFAHELDPEVERLNRAISLARRRDTATDYDVALSFAGEDRTYVDEVARVLSAAGVKVFYDKLEEADLWGKNLYTHLSDIYRKRARFTVMFISRSYAEKRWTNHEREAAQARAFADSREYILPARFDDTEIPGMLPTTGYISAKERAPTDLADLVLRKLEATSVLTK
jgi:hypothetical protein